MHSIAQALLMAPTAAENLFADFTTYLNVGVLTVIPPYLGGGLAGSYAIGGSQFTPPYTIVEGLLWQVALSGSMVNEPIQVPVASATFPTAGVNGYLSNAVDGGTVLITISSANVTRIRWLFSYETAPTVTLIGSIGNRALSYVSGRWDAGWLEQDIYNGVANQLATGPLDPDWDPTFGYITGISFDAPGVTYFGIAAMRISQSFP